MTYTYGHYITARDIAVGATCILSIVGAATIILSFLLLREVRTSVRFLLLNLSIADLLVAIINFISIAYFHHDDSELAERSEVTINNTACQVTGGVGLFAADSSILWTVAVMVYLYVSIVCHQPSKIVNRTVIMLIIITCWGIPAVISSSFIVLRFFELSQTGFCTPIYSSDKYRVIISYDIFLIPAFVVLPLLSVGFILYVSHKMKQQRNHHFSPNHYTLWRKAEVKLVFVAIVFILIRVWGLVIEIMAWAGNTKIRDPYHYVIFFLAGIGDSSQGFVNGILFCLLTPDVRKHLLHAIVKYLCCGLCCASGSREPLLQNRGKRGYGSRWGRLPTNTADGSYTGSPESMHSIHVHRDTESS